MTREGLDSVEQRHGARYGNDVSELISQCCKSYTNLVALWYARPDGNWFTFPVKVTFGTSVVRFGVRKGSPLCGIAP